VPREEVEAIAKDLFDELSTVQPGCEYTICGGIHPMNFYSVRLTVLLGYRRGKPYNNDIDLLFTHPQMGSEKHLCTKFVEHLKNIGMVKHVLSKYRPFMFSYPFN
jgi:DNA polymerase mu